MTDRRCWCGSERLLPFDDDYLDCRDCETLIVAEPPADDPARVRDEDADFYGRRYWFERQRELGQPDLEQRAVADLPDRCLHWLQAVLAYRLPPGRAFDVGCAHGGFVSLLREAGFDASGLELSPWVSDYARRTFDVPVLCGPLEDQDLEPGSFDVLAAMDVLEHVLDPAAMIARCAELLAQDGVLWIQTPRRPAGASRRQLEARGDRFLDMLLPEEHLQLFSERGLRRLLEGAGLGHVAALPAIFDHYDMFLAASRRPLVARSPDELRSSLKSSAGRRRLLAMLDLKARGDRLSEAFATADEDRTDRQRQIGELHRLLEDRDADRQRAEGLWRQELRTLEEDRQALREHLDAARQRADETRGTLDSERASHRQALAEAGEERGRLERTVAGLEEALAERDHEAADLRNSLAEQERAAVDLRNSLAERERTAVDLRNSLAEQERAAVDLRNSLAEQERAAVDLRNSLAEREAERDSARQDLEDSRCQGAELRRELTAVREDLDDARARLAEERQARAATERDLTEERHAREALAGTHAELETAHRELSRESERLADLHRRALQTLEAQDRARDAADEALARLTASSRRLAIREEALREAAEEHRSSRIYRALVAAGRWRPFDDKLRRALALPAGEEALPEATVWRLERQPLQASPGEVPEAPTVGVDLTALLPGGENGGAKLVATALVRTLSRLEPAWRFVLLTSDPCHEELAALDAGNVRRLRVRPEGGALRDLLPRRSLDLLLCPMTAPPFLDPRVPLVCVVHDLQFRAYPDFFSPQERGARERDFRRAVDHSARVITVSDYVRGTVLDSSEIDPERVVAVHNGLVHDPAAAASDTSYSDKVLTRQGLERDRFLLYPANFWPHKNHRMLLTAFAIFRHRHPESRWKLVLPGAGRPDPAPIRDAARRMGLEDHVVFPGFVSAAELSALLAGCAALVFPSLYEGFGIPVIEAMAAGRPVLASDAASLPEVAGDAALLFDPRKPHDIAAAIERLATTPRLGEELRARGTRRAREIGDLEVMARGYRDVLRQALAAPRPLGDGLFGVQADGWTEPRFLVSFRDAGSARVLELELFPPPGSSAHPVTLAGRTPAGRTFRAPVPCQRPLNLHCELPAGEGWLELTVDPPFVPCERGLNADSRTLGLKLATCRIAGPGDEAASIDLLREDRGHG